VYTVEAISATRESSLGMVPSTVVIMRSVGNKKLGAKGGWDGRREGGVASGLCVNGDF
jgi:hypothetical protein